jgi:uncharacterized caspase-like protein
MNDHDRAVVIGIRRYPDATVDPSKWITTLEGPDNDADAVAEWLRRPDGGGLPKDNVTVVRSANYPDPFAHANEVGPQQQTIQQALNAVAKLPDTAFEGQHTGRRLYIYVSGHGYAQQRNEAALVTAEAERAFPFNVEVTSWLDWFWKAARFKEFVLWADCCATRAPVAVLTRCGRTPIIRGNASDGRVFTAFAAKFDKRAVEAKMEDGNWHGVFTWALLKGLEGAAAPSGVVTSNSLHDYLINNMRSFMRQDQRDNQGIAQEPDFGKVEPITFASLPSASRYPVTLRFPANCIGNAAKIVTSASRPPAATTVLAETDWKLELEAGSYAALVPTLSLVHPFTITGGNASGAVIAL